MDKYRSPPEVKDARPFAVNGCVSAGGSGPASGGVSASVSAPFCASGSLGAYGGGTFGYARNEVKFGFSYTHSFLPGK